MVWARPGCEALLSCRPFCSRVGVAKPLEMWLDNFLNYTETLGARFSSRDPATWVKLLCHRPMNKKVGSGCVPCRLAAFPRWILPAAGTVALHAMHAQNQMPKMRIDGTRLV